MTDLQLVLDHIGVAVRSLDAGQAAYARLGFTLTPRSFHSGAREPGGPVEPWGSGNHCAMFRDGYLEILGIHDPNLYCTATALLAKYEGAHIVAFGCDDADAAHAVLSRRMAGINRPAALERDAAYGDGVRRARFRNIYPDHEAIPEGRIIVIEHETRDVLWQPALLDHANGVTGLAEVAFCTDDLAATRARLSTLLGVPAADKAPGVVALDLPRGRVYAMTADAIPHWAPGVTPPRVPCVAGFGLTVADLDKTRALLAANGVAFHDHPYPAIWVGPEFTCGPVLSFIQG